VAHLRPLSVGSLTAASALIAALFVAPTPAQGQVALPTPRASPQASVTQLIGLTPVTVNYHRPGVKGRTIWGGLVPYGQVWRAGANQNTTLGFSSPMTVGGELLAAGTYGLHIIPERDSWTVILNNNSNLWGSMGYSAKQDALRLEVVPQDAPFEEWMGFSFAPVDDRSAMLDLRWENLKVSMLLEVDLAESTLAAVEAAIEEMGEDPERQSLMLVAAAELSVDNGLDLDRALAWVDRAVEIKKTFSNLGLKAQLLEKLGRGSEAAPYKAEAWTVASEADLSKVGGQLMAGRRYADAVPVFQLATRSFPKSWKAHDQLGEAYRKSGNAEQAIEAYGRALDLATEDGTRARLEKTIEDLKGA
jgi:tetratricopeptide (TPR) repeat protein